MERLEEDRIGENSVMTYFPEHMKRSEVAKYLNVHPNTVINWTRNRHIPCVKIGRVVRYPKKLVDLWMNQNTDMDRGGIGCEDLEERQI